MVDKITFDENSLAFYVEKLESLLAIFFRNNLLVQYLKSPDLKTYFKEPEKLVKLHSLIEKNINDYFVVKTKEFKSEGEYAFWLDSYLTKIRRLGYLNFDRDCERS